MKHLFLTSLIALTAMYRATAQTQVQPYSPGVTTDGVVYHLPQTELQIAITATRTTQHPGDFHNYSQRFLRLYNVVQAQHTEWKIDNIQLVSVGTPDTSKTYLVSLKKGTSAPLCTLTDDGILMAINMQATPYVRPELKDVKSVSSNKMNSRNFLSQEILSAGSELKMAELVASEIYAIRESRSELTKGEADYMPKDGEQLKLMLTKLDEQEAALLQLFNGYTQTETKTWFLTYRPEIGKERDIVARFSDKQGLVDVNDLCGAPIYITVTNKNTVPHGKTELIDKKLIDKVVYYNLPSQAVVDLSFNGASLLKRQLPIAQFGHEEYLTDDLFNKRATCKILFNPVTGNIEKIEDDSFRK